MKKCFNLLLIIVILSCSKKGSDTPNPISNTPPSIPVLIYPTNNLLCIDNALAFDWQASTDDGGDVITYEIQIADNNTFNNLIHSSTTNSTIQEITLEKGLAYYWRAKAIDHKNSSSEYSEIFQFYTEGEGISNHLPFNPTLLKPTLESTVSGGSVTLEWSALDVDNDSLTFNVYLGTDENPGLVSENQSEISYSVNSLESDTTYFWKITVLDDKDANTIGQVWNFNTEN